MKIFKSKDGYQFGIVRVPKPSTNDTVYFLEEEWIWMKQQNLSSQEFSYLWHAKRDDYRYQMIPESHQTEAARLAKHYGDAIIASLKGLKNDDLEKVSLEGEKQK